MLTGQNPHEITLEVPIVRMSAKDKPKPLLPYVQALVEKHVSECCSRLLQTIAQRQVNMG